MGSQLRRSLPPPGGDPPPRRPAPGSRAGTDHPSSRARRVRSAISIHESPKDLVDDDMNGTVRAHHDPGLVERQRLKRGELACDQAGGHVVIMPPLQPPRELGRRHHEVHEPDRWVASPQQMAVGPAERRTVHARACVSVPACSRCARQAGRWSALTGALRPSGRGVEGSNSMVTAKSLGAGRWPSPARQAPARCASMSTARYRNPLQVGRQVMSATNSRSSPVGANWRYKRSGAGAASRSRRVVLVTSTVGTLEADATQQVAAWLGHVGCRTNCACSLPLRRARRRSQGDK